MPNQQRKFCDGPVRVEALRLVRRSGSPWTTGCVAMLSQPSGRKGHTTATTQIQQEVRPNRTLIFPSLPTLWGNHCGSDNRDCHTHNLAQPLCPSGSQHHWHLAVYQAPTSRLCGHARRRSTSTPPAMDKQHTNTAKAIALCALQRPTCPQSSAIERHPTGMYPQQRKDNGDQSTIWRGHTRPTTSPRKEKEGGRHQQRVLC